MGIRHCWLCDAEYDADQPREVYLHRRRCERWVQVCRTLGYTPAPGAVREQWKESGRKTLHSDAHEETRFRGMLQHLRAYYDASLRSAIWGGYWQQHPTFETYVAMVGGWFVDLGHPELLERLRRRYGRQEGDIPPGYSQWEKPGKNRQRQWASAMSAIRNERKGQASASEPPQEPKCGDSDAFSPLMHSGERTAEIGRPI